MRTLRAARRKDVESVGARVRDELPLSIVRLPGMRNTSWSRPRRDDWTGAEPLFDGNRSGGPAADG